MFILSAVAVIAVPSVCVLVPDSAACCLVHLRSVASSVIFAALWMNLLYRWSIFNIEELKYLLHFKTAIVSE